MLYSLCLVGLEGNVRRWVVDTQPLIIYIHLLPNLMLQLENLAMTLYALPPWQDPEALIRLIFECYAQQCGFQQSASLTCLLCAHSLICQLCWPLWKSVFPISQSLFLGRIDCPDPFFLM